MMNRATMSEQYTPTMWLVRARYCDSTARGEQDDAQALSVPREVHEKNHAEFDRWLAKRDAEVAAKALEDAARAFDGGTISLDVFSNEVEKSYWRVANEQRSILVDSLRARAAEYRKAVKS